MSYILDALRRADAERQQGQVPGLHAAADTPAAPPWTARPALLGWGAAVGVALAGLLVVVWPRTPTQPVAVPPAAALPAAAARVAPALPLVVASVASAAAPAQLPMVVSAAAPAVPAVMPAPSANRAAAPAAPAAPTASAAALAAAPKPLPLQQLGAEQRRELPRLAVGGSVWSDSAASRFVILDGQVMREGDSVAPGLVLESIQPKAAILRWRELRLELAL